MTRVVFITGASQNAGQTMAEHFAQRGDIVVVNGRDPDRIAATVEKIRGAGGQAHASRGDIGSPDEVHRMISETEATVGPVDVLVHSATARKHAPGRRDQLRGLVVGHRDDPDRRIPLYAAGRAGRGGAAQRQHPFLGSHSAHSGAVGGTPATSPGRSSASTAASTCDGTRGARRAAVVGCIT